MRLNNSACDCNWEPYYSNGAQLHFTRRYVRVVARLKEFCAH